MSITVVVPTIGRSSLSSCLSSFAYQLHPEDAVVVVADGKNNDVGHLVQRFSKLYPSADWTYDWIWSGKCWGHPAANHALDRHVATSHVWRLDDDDQAEEGALDAMRNHSDDYWTIFRMTFGAGHKANGITCWYDRTVRFGNIGTPMMFAATSDARFGSRYEGDLDYATQLQAQFGDPIWDEQVVALIRPVDDPVAA